MLRLGGPLRRQTQKAITSVPPPLYSRFLQLLGPACFVLLGVLQGGNARDTQGDLRFPVLHGKRLQDSGNAGDMEATFAAPTTPMLSQACRSTTCPTCEGCPLPGAAKMSARSPSCARASRAQIKDARPRCERLEESPTGRGAAPSELFPGGVQLAWQPSGKAKVHIFLHKLH